MRFTLNLPFSITSKQLQNLTRELLENLICRDVIFYKGIPYSIKHMTYETMSKIINGTYDYFCIGNSKLDQYIEANLDNFPPQQAEQMLKIMTDYAIQILPEFITKK